MRHHRQNSGMYLIMGHTWIVYPYYRTWQSRNKGLRFYLNMWWWNLSFLEWFASEIIILVTCCSFSSTLMAYMLVIFFNFSCINYEDTNHLWKGTNCHWRREEARCWTLRRVECESKSGQFRTNMGATVESSFLENQITVFCYYNSWLCNGK